MNVITTGFVSDNQDPDKEGRIKVNVYLSMDAPLETDWIPILQGFAGDDMGIYCLPDIGECVVCAFTDNRYEEGFVMGSLAPLQLEVPLSGENGDADCNGDGKNALKMIKTKADQRVILDDTEGAEKIQILNPDGTARIELNGEEEMINILTETDITINADTVVSIEAEEMEINLDKDLTVQCDNLGMKAGGDGTVKASGSVAIEGKGVGIN